MRVSRLEIFGFKSFVERFVLNFDRNMIGIVGPNGCGKSNVVDSLRWVLGETHAKHLRGTVLDDLIFNGSESRRPLGMAEVSITVRPSEGWEEMVPESINLAEEPAADIARAATESGEAAAPDAAEAGSETAAALSIASPAEEQIAAQYNPRPAIFSEVPGLLGASEIQFTRRLYRSGESEFFINRVPCRLRDMIDIYRLIGLGARGLSIVQQGEIGQLISKKPVERRELLEEAAGISGFRTRMEAAQRKLEKTYENMARLKDIILEVLGHPADLRFKPEIIRYAEDSLVLDLKNRWCPSLIEASVADNYLKSRSDLVRTDRLNGAKIASPQVAIHRKDESRPEVLRFLEDLRDLVAQRRDESAASDRYIVPMDLKARHRAG